MRDLRITYLNSYNEEFSRFNNVPPPQTTSVRSYPPSQPQQPPREAVPAPVQKPIKPQEQGPKTKSKSSKGSKANNAATLIGPTLPPVKPEDLARDKIRHFEETLASGVFKDLDKEVQLLNVCNLLTYVCAQLSYL